MAVFLGASYGFFMGWFGLVSRPAPNYLQIAASMIKLPALFLLTLLVTLPSLYVFNALMGSRLSFGATLRLLVAAVVVNLAVAAALGPILGFFTISTTSYPFMILLNVALLAIAGFVGLGFLLKVLRRVATYQTSLHLDEMRKSAPVPSPLVEDEELASRSPTPPGATPIYGRPPGVANVLRYDAAADSIGQANAIFRVWVFIYGLVGAQMGWLLRPFIGSPDMPFTWFRHRQGNFFQSFFHHLQSLFGG